MTESTRPTGFRSGFTPMESLDQVSADPGYFGPESLSWRVHHDPASVVGGIRALALQSLHPDVMLGFDRVTGAHDDPWGRLSRTGKYVNEITYGTVAEADAAAARVRRVHAALGLDRPEWLLWVHCGAVDSWLEGHRRSGAPLTDPEADRYVEEQVIAARLVGCEVAGVPTTVQGLHDYLRDVRPQLEATPQARDAVRALLWPPMQPRVEWLTPARPAWTALALTGFGLLPRWARRMFALPGLPVTDLSASVSARALRAALVAVPESRRTNPHLAAARIRLGLAEPEQRDAG
ncbi:MAG TPA: oxygenase MpaB family protein [Candidatus Nanopelagicales bacterium]|nr:oxygenase MpaB family protein [Candidatus Nanopelagicales bacterium]